MNWFGMMGLMIGGAWWYAAMSRQFDHWFPYPATARWTLGIAFGVLFLAGFTGDPNCFVDWDGVSNPVVCD